MIADQIRDSVVPGMRIPKPEAKADFFVKTWGRRRGEPALIYLIPNHKNPDKVLAKGITESEFEQAYAELKLSGEFTRTWFNSNLPKCANEGGCNFTTIGGVFEMMGLAQYTSRGIYTGVSQ
jgi:hypothetical protein